MGNVSRSLLVAGLVSWLGLGCSGTGQLTPGDDGAPLPPGSAAGPDGDVPSVQPTPASPNFPFTAMAPRSYVNKVKTLLTGLAADANEVARGAEDAGLAALVDGYMANPRFQDVLLDFFGLAFQQSAVTDLSFLYMTHNGFMSGQDADEFRSSFARTALYTVNNDLPFNQLMSTQRFMVTPKMLWHMAVMEGYNDGGERNADYMLSENPNFTVYLDPQRGATSLQDLLNPSSSNYLRFYRPDLTKLTDRSPDCGLGTTNPVALGKGVYVPLFAGALMNFIHGGDYTYYKGGGCYVPGGATSFAEASDHNWRLVTIRTPRANEKPHTMLDAYALRSASEVRFRIPRVGFFTTPAFFGQWGTNLNNQARVTVNQTLAVALNRVFDGSDATVPTDLRALPATHATPDTPCYGCHLTMDPMRQYFLHQLSYSYSPQLNPNQIALTGAFGQLGTRAAGGDLTELGAQLASSPQFALAWTQKVCTYLNSAPCAEDDPELARIAALFVRANFSFKTLFKAVATSPLTTYKSATKTASDRGTVVTTSRTRQICQTFSARLGVDDLCVLKRTTYPYAFYQAAGWTLSGMPIDGYGRGSTALNQIRTPSLTQRIGLENVCIQMTSAAVDNSVTGAPFNSGDPNAVQRILTQLMGLSVVDDADVLAVLQRHHDDVLAKTNDRSHALRSTFVLACLSPAVAMIGL